MMKRVVVFFCLLVVVEGLAVAADLSSTNGTGTEGEKKGKISESEKTFLTKIHGTCFIFAWFFCISTAFFGARYLRDYLQDFQPWGIRVWFHIHRTLNMVAICLITGGFVAIMMAHEWRWSGPKIGGHENTSAKALHGLFGLVSVIIAWIQPLNSLIRCNPNHPKRIYFNWIHRILGIAGWILAATAIVVACGAFGKRFSKNEVAVSISGAFLGFCGASFIVAEFYKIRNTKMKELTGIQKSNEKWNFHSILVSVYGVVALTVCILLFVLIVGSTSH